MTKTLLAVITLVALTACSEAASEPTEVQTEALIAAAPAWTPEQLTRDLQVDAATRQQIEDGIEAMHASMLALHDRYQQADQLSGDEREAAMDALDAEVQVLHAEHRKLWESLDADVRETLAARFHTQMREHEDGAMKTFHERMRRLHGDHAPAGVGH